MNTDLVISSAQNPRIKRLLALQQKPAMRRKEGLTVVEGQRELQHCLDAGFEVETLFRCQSMNSDTIVADIDASMVEVTRDVYARIAYRGSTEGIIAIVRPRLLTLDELNLGDKPLLIVLESVEKPGNLGAVLRSADAAAATAVIVCDPLTDLYNPNVIRSSIGAIFTVPCVACDTTSCINFLKRNRIAILTAQLQDSSPYYDTDMTRATALVMGTEATGLTDAWRQAADAHICIPMNGALDSLNVSVSAAILLFEAVRQRNSL